MQKRIKYFVIQGFYGYCWEDVSFYSQGIRQANRRTARQEAYKDLKEYNLMGYAHRIIERYEIEED